MTDIEKFLENPADTQQGIALFSRYGRNKNLIKLFSKKPEQMKSKLLYELGKIKHRGCQVSVSSEQLTVNSEQKAVDSEQLTVNSDQKVVSSDVEKMQITVAKGEKVVVEKNTALEQLNALQSNIYKESDALFLTRLNQSNSKEERYEAAKTIVTNYKEKLPPIHKKIDAIVNGNLSELENKEQVVVEKKQKSPKKVKKDKYDITDIDDRAVLMQLLQNVRTNISKNKNNAARKAKWEKVATEIQHKLDNGS